MFVTDLGTFILGAIAYVGGRSYRCRSRLGARATFTKLKPEQACLHGASTGAVPKETGFFVLKENLMKKQTEIINLILSKDVFEVPISGTP